MRWRTLLRRNLTYHRRGNFAVLLGVAVGTAVLTGALLVGDSLRGSLRERAERQLAGVEQILLANTSFTSETHDNLVIAGFDLLPIMVTRGSIEVLGPENKPLHRVGNVTVIRVTRSIMLTGSHLLQSYLDRPSVNSPSVMSGWLDWFRRKTGLLSRRKPVPFEEFDQAITSDLAAQLGVVENQVLRLRDLARTNIHPESALGRKEGIGLFKDTEFKAHILNAENPLNEFNLTPELGSNRTVYLCVDPSFPILQSNGFLAHGAVPTNSELRNILNLADYQLVIRTPKNRLLRRNGLNQSATNYFSVESNALLLPPVSLKAALETGSDLNLPAKPTLVYLANSISDGQHEIPYSVIAALDPQAAAPLGPFLSPSERPLGDDEILLADWPESPLTAKPGDTITIKYFLPESEGKATEATATFKLRAKVPMTGPAADPFLTPEFPGITDKLSLGEWDPPFPYDNRKITKRDEDYWDKYRATPKAYVNWAVGQKLFASRFGVATSVRIAPKSPATIEQDAEAFAKTLRDKLNPADFGFVFENVRHRALDAAQGGTDFGMLFLGFSFFLIAAALLLVSLLVRLNLDRRASELGLWLATGYSMRSVRRLLLIEGLILAAFGALLGLGLAVGYAALMLRLLAALWPAGDVGSFLQLHVTGTSLGIGCASAIVVSGIAIALALRALKRISPTALLRGVTSTYDDLAAKRFSRPWIAIALLIVALASLAAGPFFHGHEARAGSFFTGGAALLTCGLLFFRRRLLASTDTASSPNPSIVQLGARCAARNPARSLLTAGLLAAAAFLLVAVESFRRNPEADFATKSGGSGGFALIASTDLPLYQDPNDPAGGRQEMLEALERFYQRDPATRAAKLAEAENLLAASDLVPLRVQAGDEAGCRNLYKPNKPRLVGVPRRLIDRGGFHFASTLAKTPEEKANPWLLLLESGPNGEVPVFGEANTVAWMLKKSLGDTLDATDSRGQLVKLRIVGLFQDSIFQGELVMADSQFLKLYPETQGYPMVLAESPPGQADELRTILETAYAERGLTVEPAINRLQSYLAVENTYLSTFQVLGGFGLLLGACGLGVVLVRSAWERRGELALLRAIGFRRRDVGWLVLSENLLLLAVGLAIGVIAALASVLPQWLGGQAATVPVARLTSMLAMVLFMGGFAGLFALRSALRAPIVAALRGE